MPMPSAGRSPHLIVLLHLHWVRPGPIRLAGPNGPVGDTRSGSGRPPKSARIGTICNRARRQPPAIRVGHARSSRRDAGDRRRRVVAVVAVVVAALATLAVLALAVRRAHAHGRSAKAGRGVEHMDSTLVPPLRIPPAANGGIYAPSFLVEPGQCFRLCRDPATDDAYPCDRDVEGIGQFVDHRGNVIEVEACAAHRVDLVNWQFRPIEG